MDWTLQLKNKIAAIFILGLICSISALAQDSLKAKRQIRYGAEYNINTGYFYAHSIGAIATINDKHQFGVDGLLIPGINPMKDRMNYGAAMNYNFLPNKTNNRLDAILTSSLYYENYKSVNEYTFWPNNLISRSEYISNGVSLFIGFGLNINITKRINISTSVSSYIFDYGSYKSKYIDYQTQTETNYSNKSLDRKSVV